MSAAAAPKAKKAAKPKVAAAHPPFGTMIAAAIKALKERNGSSRQAILKYIVANYKVGDAAKAQLHTTRALRKLSADKKLVAGGAAGKKGAGSFKLPVAAKAEKPKKAAAKKPAAKKVAKKPAAKATKAKKPAAKKAAKPKTPAKKPAAKKPAAKKPAAKKPAAKKAAPKKK
jgi:histone H1/5